MYKKTVASIIFIVISVIIFKSSYKEVMYQVENYNNIDINMKNTVDIPQIRIREIYTIQSINKSVIKGIVMFSEYGRPDIEYSNTIIGAHSGVGLNVYFNKLHELEVNNIFKIIYNNKLYEYKVYDKFEVNENNMNVLKEIDNKTIVTLITCKRSNPTKRIIVLGELID